MRIEVRECAQRGCASDLGVDIGNDLILIGVLCGAHVASPPVTGNALLGHNRGSLPGPPGENTVVSKASLRRLARVVVRGFAL